MSHQDLISRLVVARTGPTYRVISDLVTFKAIGEDTANAYALFECRTLPDHGVPPHRQRYEDEAFFVLEGSYTFLLGDTLREVCAGDYIFAPRGTTHAFTNTGKIPARMLILVSPGGIHENFFIEAGELVHSDAPLVQSKTPPDIAQLTAIAVKYGIDMFPAG